MPENQAHGKKWERDLGLNVYKATEDELATVSHTAPMDVPKQFNRLDGTDISIKVTGKDTIDMADIVRVFDEVSSGEAFHMTVVVWEQKTADIKKIKRIVEVDLTNAREILFGSVKREQLVELVGASKAVGKVRSDISPEIRAEQIKKAYEMRDDLHTLTGSMHFHLMFYTNNPSRVQGQFIHFSEFVKKYPERIVAQSETGEFRGGKILEEISSTKRVRNTRPAQH